MPSPVMHVDARRIGMAAWLSLVFALVVGLSTGLVAYVFLDRFEDRFRESAEQIAAGHAIEAAIRITQADAAGSSLDDAVSEDAYGPLFVFGADGELLTSARSQGVALPEVPGHRQAVATALDGRRFVRTVGATTVVALPLSRGRSDAVLAYSRHPDLDSGLGLAREEIVEASVLGFAVGALAGSIVAWLLGLRLRRLVGRARAIERGDFERPIVPKFLDEVGVLAEAMDSMRERLRESFERLSSDRDRLERLLGRLSEGVVAVDGGLRVEFFNEAARRFFGHAPLELGGSLQEPWSGFSLREFAESLFGQNGATAHAYAAAGENTFALAGIPSEGSDFALIVMVDVSQDERRERAQREFVANAAHELRTPLQTILGAVEALESGAKDEPVERDRFLAHIGREGRRLARLTRALLVLARAQTGAEPARPRRTAVRPLLERIARTTKPRPGVDLVVSCPPGLATMAESDLAEQVLTTLASNAAKHTEAGRIVIAGLQLAEDAVAVEIRDTGSGIPREQQERIYERFYRGDGRRDDGFGLGLAIAREGARVLGGKLEVESQLGKGTVARLIVPAGGDNGR